MAKRNGGSTPAAKISTMTVESTPSVEEPAPEIAVTRLPYSFIHQAVVNEMTRRGVQPKELHLYVQNGWEIEGQAHTDQPFETGNNNE